MKQKNSYENKTEKQKTNILCTTYLTSLAMYVVEKLRGEIKIFVSGRLAEMPAKKKAAKRPARKA
ncbi:MAG: hypothetical protein M3Q64_02135, partial [bacterium]|nr:hypothetical protein [bacterium]